MRVGIDSLALALLFIYEVTLSISVIVLLFGHAFHNNIVMHGNSSHLEN